MNSKKLIRVIAAIIRNEAGNILIARRPKHKDRGGLWEFPGGKLEPGENETSCLAREVEEELGIKAAIGDFYMEASHESEADIVVMRTYKITGFKGNIVSLEHSEIRWVALNQLSRYKFPPVDMPVVRRLLLEK